MAVTQDNSGTQTCTVTTEHTLDDVAAAGVYIFEADMALAAAGDVFELRVKKITLASGTLRTVFFQMVQGAQFADNMIRTSVPIPNALTDAASLRFTIKQTFGTGRNIPWSTTKIA
jgi:hypothetical protein